MLTQFLFLTHVELELVCTWDKSIDPTVHSIDIDDLSYTWTFKKSPLL